MKGGCWILKTNREQKIKKEKYVPANGNLLLMEKMLFSYTK